MERKGLPESHQKHMEVISDEEPGKNIHLEVGTKNGTGRQMKLPRKLQVIVCFPMTHLVPVSHPWAARLWIKALHWDLGSFLLK